MIVLKLFGGLGNQMFQYALYLKLNSLGKEVVFDLSFFDCVQHKNLLIDKYFDVALPTVDYKIIQKMADSKLDIISRIRRKVFGNKGRKYIDRVEEYQPEIFDFEDIYLEGYWQSEKYFLDISDKVRERFKMKKMLTDYQKCVLTEIKQEESVGVHVRRGDYIKLKHIYGDICTNEYYKKAFEMLRTENTHFFIFTNDYDYVSKTCPDQRNITVIRPEKTYPYANMDMLLMKECKKNIIANSSFSWWSAWLNDNLDKTVIAPGKWINGLELNDIYCHDWIKI